MDLRPYPVAAFLADVRADFLAAEFRRAVRRDERLTAAEDDARRSALADCWQARKRRWVNAEFGALVRGIRSA